MTAADETGDFWRLLAALKSDSRFRAAMDLGFPAADATVEPSSSDGPATIATTFLGLGGVDSPLPGYLLTALAHHDEDDDGTALLELLDVLHDRLIQHFVEVSTAFDLTGPKARYEAAAGAGAARAKRLVTSQVWIDRLLSLGGVDQDTSAALQNARPWRVLRLASIMVNGWRSAWALEAALRDCVEPGLPPGARLDVVEFVGEWSSIHRTSRSALGLQNASLGTHAVLGEAVPDIAGRLSLRIGDVPEAWLDRLDSGGDLGGVLDAVVVLFVDEPLEIELRLTVAEMRAEAVQLGGPAVQHLGRSAWLGGHQSRRRVFRRSVPGDRAGRSSEWMPVDQR
jgi:type VI secretion system protein ImpH